MAKQTCRYQADPKESEAISRQVVEQIKKLGVAFNPIHFTLLFEQISQIEPEFALQIEDLIARNAYSEESVRPLFVGLLKRILNRHLPTEEVGVIISNVLTNLDQWVSLSKSQQQELDESLKCLCKCETREDILDCLNSRILPPIQQIHNQTEALHQQLNHSAEVIRKLKQELDQATSLAKTDSLTGIANRRGFDELLANQIEHAKQKRQTFAMLILDLDHFKKINDRFGHLVGDSALRYIAKTLISETKGQDAIARLGGEEFVILLSDINYDDALKVSEKIRKLIAAKSLRVRDHDLPLRFTISIGVAMYQMGEKTDNLFDRADKALYLAKQSGRNRVCGEHQL